MPKQYDIFILPIPKKVLLSGGYFKIPTRIKLESSETAFDFSVIAKACLKLFSSKLRTIEIKKKLSSKPYLQFSLTSTSNKKSTTQTLNKKRFGKEGYRLTITRTTILIEAHFEGGIFNALQSLKQLIRNHDRIPCCVIEDWPDMAVRGIHIDMKGCTPTVEYILQHDRYKNLQESNKNISQYCLTHTKTFPFWQEQAEEFRASQYDYIKKLEKDF